MSMTRDDLHFSAAKITELVKMDWSLRAMDIDSFSHASEIRIFLISLVFRVKTPCAEPAQQLSRSYEYMNVPDTTKYANVQTQRTKFKYTNNRSQFNRDAVNTTCSRLQNGPKPWHSPSGAMGRWWYLSPTPQPRVWSDWDA